MVSLFLASISFFSCNDANKETDSGALAEENAIENMKELITSNEDDLYRWAGTYQGIMPCASCEGIETFIVLNSNGTYQKSQIYLTEENEEFDEEGTIEWDNDNFTMTLYPNDDSAESQIYEYDGNNLIALKQDGTRVTGALAEYYILEKQ